MRRSLILLILLGFLVPSYAQLGGTGKVTTGVDTSIVKVLKFAGTDPEIRTITTAQLQVIFSPAVTPILDFTRSGNGPRITGTILGPLGFRPGAGQDLELLDDLGKINLRVNNGGGVQLDSSFSILENGATPTQYGIFDVTQLSDTRTYTFPDVTGEASLLGQSISSTEIIDGTIGNIDLANSSVTVTAGNQLSGGGTVALGASISLAVTEGSGSGLDADLLDGQNLVSGATTVLTVVGRDAAGRIQAVDPSGDQDVVTKIYLGAGFQPLDATLTDFADGTVSGEKITFTRGLDVSGLSPVFSSGLTVNSISGAAIGSDVQAYDADLTDLADGSLTGSKVGTGISATNVTTGTLVNTVLDAQLAALAVITPAANVLPVFMSATSATTATVTVAGRALLDDADASAQRTTLGLGSIATQNSNAISISGGTITGITDLTVADGGTGVSTLTDGGILLGHGSSAITGMAALADGAIVIGDGTTDPTTLSAFTSSTGTLKHEYGGIEANISAVIDNDFLVGTGVGTIGLESGSTARTSLGVQGLVDDSMADALHRHSELSASDGTPNPALQVNSVGNIGIGTVPVGWHTTRVALELGGNNAISSMAGVTPSSVLEIGNNTNYDTDATWEYISTSEASLYSQANGVHSFYVVPSGTAGNDITWTNVLQIQNDGDLAMPQDSDALRLGVSADLNLFHDGTNSIIDNNTGNLNIYGSTAGQVNLMLVDGTETGISLAANGAATLYYDNAAKLATSTTGAGVTGTLAATTVTGANVTSGADPGHTHTMASLTVEVENIEMSATTDDYVLYDNAGVLSSWVDKDVIARTDIMETFDLGLKVRASNVEGTPGLEIHDLEATSFGEANGLTAYNALGGFGINDGAGYTYHSRVTAGNIETHATFSLEPSVIVRAVQFDETSVAPMGQFLAYQYDGVGTATTDFMTPTEIYKWSEQLSTGVVDVMALDGDGDLHLKLDGGHFFSGADNDLRIGHNGTMAQFDNNTGPMAFWSNTDIALLPVDGTEYGIDINANSSVDLYYDNVKKLATTTGGIDVTGTTVSDSLHTDLGATFAGMVGIGTATPSYKLDVVGGAFSVSYSGVTTPITTFGGNGNGNNALEIMHLNQTNGPNPGDVGQALYQTFNFQKIINSVETNSEGARIYVGKESDWVSVDNADVDAFMSFYTIKDGTLAEKVRIDAAGNVGIGTTGPKDKLQIQGADGASTRTTWSSATQLIVDNNANTFIEIGTGNSHYSGLSFVDTDAVQQGMIIYDHGTALTGAADNMGFYTNGARAVTITSAGNVGIGTTGPTTKLQVVADATTTHAIKGQAGVAGAWGGLFYDNDASAEVLLGGSSYAALFNGGNVGIGTTTPDRLLHISSASPEFIVEETDAALDEKQWRWSQSAGVMSLQAIDDAITSASTAILLERSGATVTEVNFPTGNVGIGTTGPGAKLQVNNAAAASASGLEIAQFGSTYSGGVAGYGGYISFTDLTSTAVGRIYSTTESSNNIGLSFYTYNSGLSEKVRINAAGNVGIGTTTPGAKLDLYRGGFKLSGNFGDSVPTITTSIAENEISGTRYDAGGDAGDLILSAGGQGTLNRKMNIILHGYGTVDDAQIRLQSGSAALMTLLYTGNVGIGTTGPIAKLDILSATRSGTHPPAIKGLYVTGDFGAASDGVEFRHSNATQGIGFGYTSIYAAGTNANQDLNLMPKGTGNVGIGTTAPLERLHIADTANLGRYLKVDNTGRTTIQFNDNAISNGLSLTNTLSGAANYGIAIAFSHGYSGSPTVAGTAINSSKIISAGEQSWTPTASTQDAYLSFQTALDGALAERMRITSGGNVGIGTTPNNKLTVYNASGGIIDLETSDAAVIADDVLGTLEFRGLDASTLHQIGAKITAAGDGIWSGSANDAPGRLEFYTQSDGTGDGLASPRMVIGPSGHVYIPANKFGVGDTSPNEEVDVVGTVSIGQVASTPLLKYHTVTTGGGNDDTLSVFRGTLSDLADETVATIVTGLDTLRACRVDLTFTSSLGEASQATYAVNLDLISARVDTTAAGLIGGQSMLAFYVGSCAGTTGANSKVTLCASQSGGSATLQIENQYGAGYPIDVIWEVLIGAK